MSIFSGVFPYLVTPIDARGNVKQEIVERLCEHLIGYGVHGLTPLGSTGECAYLDERQRTAMIEATVATAAGRVPVIAGVAGISTRAAIAQATLYKTLGVDGLMVSIDTYFPLKEQEIEDYFTAVADATDLPIAIYTNPRFQHLELPIALIEKLSFHPRVVAIKDASTNTGRLLSIVNLCKGRLAVVAASTHIPTSVMMIGGTGWFSGPACIVPRQSIELHTLCTASEWDKAMALQRRLWPINELFARFSMAACIKTGLELQGFAVGDPIHPQKGLSAADRGEIAAALDDLADAGCEPGIQ